jgi:hypothetical protein
MAKGFQVVEDVELPPTQSVTEQAGLNMLVLGMKTLSQRAAAAVVDSFLLLTVGSAWWLWWSTPDPNPHQIVSLAIYAGFVLAANLIYRKVRR